jgi:hypothetical protein
MKKCEENNKMTPNVEKLAKSWQNFKKLAKNWQFQKAGKKLAKKSKNWQMPDLSGKIATLLPTFICQFLYKKVAKCTKFTRRFRLI